MKTQGTTKGTEGLFMDYLENKISNYLVEKSLVW